VLALLLSGLGGRTKLGLGMALSTVATYSYANGLSTWFVAAPLVALVLGWRALAHWVLGLTLNAAVYFDGYTRPWYHPALVEGLRPTRLAHYQLAFAGSPWGMDRLSVATLAGASVLVCFASALVYLMVRRPDRELWRKMLPWLAIGFYTLASGLLSGIGRVAWGVKMALLDRYIPFSLYIAVACVFLVPLVLRDAHHVGLIGPRLHRVARGVVASGIVLFLAFQAEATALGVRVIRQEGRMRRYAKSCLLLMNVHLDQECLSTRVYPNVAMLRGWAGELDRLGYLHPSLARGRLQGMHAPRSDVAAAGVFESFSQVTPQRYVAVGWAASPTRRAPADAVILALEDPHGVWVPWQIRPVEHPRPDVAARYGTEYVNVGWRRRVLQHELPLRPFRIGAWAFDAETAWVLPLERTYLVESDRTDR
jgi:hypothetical protein